jgi:hypothetical protein
VYTTENSESSDLRGGSLVGVVEVEKDDDEDDDDDEGRRSEVNLPLER